MEIIIFVGFLILLRFIIKNTRVYKIVLATILILAAIPIGIFVEMGINGCCGAPSSNYGGVGYVLMAVLLISGFLLLITSIKQAKK